jgi:Methyltransferase domain
MPSLTLRHRLRLLTNALVARIPRPAIRIFLRSFEWRRDISESIGYDVIPRRFGSPVASKVEIDFEKLSQRRNLPGIELNERAGLELVQKLVAYTQEVEDIPYEDSPGAPFWFDNASFTDFDAFTLYALLRHLKPKRYIELGCGFSSFMSSRALTRNATDGAPSDAVYADPEPRREMAQTLSYGRLIKKRVQELPMELFTQLEAGDVLFIDTSHVLKLQGDVEHEVLRIVPSLKPGVWIHFHDVFTPYDYPEDWLIKPLALLCNEQYVVEALLSGGDRYMVELPLYLIWKEHFEALRTVFPRGSTRPQGFWIRKAN